jgi:hypothetical protein
VAFDTVLHSAAEVKADAESKVYVDTVEEMMVARLINDAKNAGRTEVMCISQLSDRLVSKLERENYTYKSTSSYPIDNAPHIISWKDAESEEEPEPADAGVSK